MQTTIFLYHITDKKLQQSIQFTAARLKCRIKIISEELASQKVGYIAGLEGFSQESSGQAAEIPACSVLLLQGFAGKKLDALLMGLRRAGVPRSILKEVQNETNKEWYFCDLCRELEREHQKMNKSKAE